MGFFKSITDAIYREYDRRIKRASLVTEYGAHHHAHADESEGPADQHAGSAATAPNVTGTHGQVVDVGADHDDAEDEAEIVNVPRGTQVAPIHPVPTPSETDADGR